MAVFIGNFVNDIIVRCVGEEERISHATGGSVTYGSLAAVNFGSTPPPKIISKVGNDLPKPFLDSLRHRNIGLDSVQFLDGKNTSYKLHYDRSGRRTLSLKERGYPILSQDIVDKIGQPEAIFFVPVAAEFSEDVVLEVMQSLQTKFGADETYRPIVALDVQGFVRDLAGSRVLTLSHEAMVQKFEKLSSLQSYGSITMLKAEHAEAVVIVGDLSPPECAKELRVKYGFSIVSVTMGHLGSFLSSEITGEVYIPAFKPNQVLDETGCGDTFLTCAVLELLLHKHNLVKSPGGPAGSILAQYHREDLIQAMLVGSAAASYLVEKIGPEGFANRDQILERIKNSERTTEGLEIGRAHV